MTIPILGGRHPCNETALKCEKYIYRLFLFSHRQYIKSMGVNNHLKSSNILEPTDKALNRFSHINWNPRMHLFHIPQYPIQDVHVHISVLNRAFWDIKQVHSGICELGQ